MSALDIIHELIKNVKIGIMRNMEKKKMTQEDIMKLLDSCYEKCLNGIPMVSPGVEDMANDYLSKHETKEKACRDMLKNQIAKCTTSGVVTGLGGFITMPVAIPANIGSVIYVQMRMIACTAYMADYDLNSDQTQTFVYACLAGVAVNSLLKQAGIKFGVKFANVVIKKIPGKVLTKINQKVGFRFITKFGSKGIVNLEKHIENVQKYDVPVVVTLNSFVTDTEAEIAYVRSFCEERGCEFALSEVWEKGGEGGIALAEKVLETLENKESHFHPLYEDNLCLKAKIETISKEIYGARGVVYEPAAEKQLAKIEGMGFGSFPVCMAKNQYSLSDDATRLGRPENFDIHIREVYVNAGAGFVVALTGAVMTMPGLPKVPAANGIDVSEDGHITGLF